MSEEIYHDVGIGKSSVLTCKRNGHIDHINEKDPENAINEDTEQNWIPVDGFPNSFRRAGHDNGTTSGIKRLKSSHHEHGKHYHKQSHHHHHHHHKRSSSSSHMSSDQKRFCRTASALKQAGLLELTLQTAQLIQENENLQKEIDSLQQQTLEFSKSLQIQLEEKVNKAKPQNGFT